MTKKTWWKLDHHLRNELKKYKLENSKVLVGLSGGPDSMALAQACVKVLGPGRVTLAHFHHGDTENKIFRDQAQDFCQSWAKEKGLAFFFKKNRVKAQSSSRPSSEAEMRELRYKFLMDLAQEQDIPIIMTGHHSGDVLETRLMRLMRGTGPQGLGAIKAYRPPFFRPLLLVSRGEIELYLSKEKLNFLTDPSNKDNHYLRNWLRTNWLPQLEKKRPGSTQVLAQSFDLIVEALAGQKQQFLGNKIHRGEFLALTEAEQKRCLAATLLNIGQRDFTQHHLEEVRRRIVESPKSNSFKVAGCNWQVNAQQIQVQLAL